jgi:TonB-dependent receptor
MTNFSKLLFLALTALISHASMAQKGTVRGRVIDGETGESLFAANAVLKGTTQGATTDFDGLFDLLAIPGTYDLEISFIGMQSTTITGVIVKAGEVTAVGDIVIKPATNELGAVTVTAEAVRNTEAAILTVKRKSANMIDGISSAKLQKIGDSDAGDAAKRVTGVSVEGGKYVYVRGLGDRYTKTMLNGVDIPGLDPDRNAIQIDIFPTNLISNMTILKTGLAELPADFAGGLVNIETKDFPNGKIFKVSAGVGYNPNMHFNNNYISYDGSTTDFLAFDGGARALPAGAEQAPIPSPLSGGVYSNNEINSFMRSFNTTLGAETSTSLMDFNLGLSLGNQFVRNNGDKWGYIFSATYRNETEFFDKVTYGEYIRLSDASDYELLYTNIQEGTQSSRNVLLGGLGGLTYKTGLSKYRFTVMHLQNGESVASQFNIDNSEDGRAVGASGYRAYVNNLEYYQRGITNVLFNGEHHTINEKWDIEWKLSPTLSNIVEPDLRRTPFTLDAASGDSIFAAGQGGNPKRIWRTLDEINAVAKLDITRNMTVFERDAKLKFGFSNVYKTRQYEILDYDLQFFGTQPDFNGDPNTVLDDDLFFPNGNLYYQEQFGTPNSNQYSSNNNNLGLYTSYEFTPVLGLKAILGLRAEQFVQRHTGRSGNAAVQIGQGVDPADLDEALENEVVLNSLDLFPSANLVYTLNENQNLRASYFRSIARPSFKELSFAQILDPTTNRTFNGGLFPYPGSWAGDLTETRINNIDLRWEYFMEAGEVISVSAFTKTFADPIELVRIPEAQTTAEFQPRNVGDGLVYGAEFEITKGLGFISPEVKNLSFSGNFTYVFSQIEMTDIEFEARQRFEKEGQKVENTRDMAGQAPYVVNAGFIYDNSKKQYNLGAFYNVKGRTLEVVGGGLFPDVYTEMFHSLNLSGSFSFGKEFNHTVSLKVANLLNDVRESFFVGFRAQDQIFSQWEPGMQASISYSYNF